MSPEAGLAARSQHTLLKVDMVPFRPASWNSSARALSPLSSLQQVSMLQDTPTRPGKLPRIAIRKHHMASQQSCPTEQIAEKDTHSRKQLHAWSTDVRQAVVPSFKRYSEGTRKSATPAASQDTDQFDEALDILDKIGAQPVSTLGENCCYDAKFAVDEIVGQGRRSGQIVYKVEWTSSKVPSRLLRYVDGRPEVKCGKQEYTVRSVCPLSPELGTNDEPQLLVAWKSTWEDEEVVKALARPHLETFLRKMRESQERDEPEDSLMQPDQGRESPIVSASELPQQAIVYSTNFKPQKRLVYNDAMRRLLRGAAGDVGEMLCYPDKNDLIFRHHYIEKNTAFNAECNRMRRAAALQMVGVKQRKKCDHCKKGCGPFRGCVVLTGFGRGACANCLYGARMPMTCNYHCRSRAERPRQPEIVSASAEGEYRDISRATTHSNDHTASPTAVAVTSDAVKEDVAGRAPQSPDTAHLMQRSPSPLALEEQKRERACSRELLPEHRIEGSSSLACGTGVLVPNVSPSQMPGHSIVVHAPSCQLQQPEAKRWPCSGREGVPARRGLRSASTMVDCIEWLQYDRVPAASVGVASPET
ncbi:hypothetical protein DOTSEDRAFT_39694 [Dothistroma septosporum NZE10]|uniref:Uncharacterized protein n=1 Tax=Dothistroma septosporum (strain NZE10 / CBS 128990) TaxID=675120 RepID=M2YI05_DOTSN|nr:hypothetical protein DOTSEDRAFT_39694 [Dothistroma septosporum NZE10]